MHFKRFWFASIPFMIERSSFLGHELDSYLKTLEFLEAFDERSSGFRVQGLGTGFKVSGLGFGPEGIILDLRFKVWV